MRFEVIMKKISKSDTEKAKECRRKVYIEENTGISVLSIRQAPNFIVM